MSNPKTPEQKAKRAARLRAAMAADPAKRMAHNARTNAYNKRRREKMKKALIGIILRKLREEDTFEEAQKKIESLVADRANEFKASAYVRSLKRQAIYNRNRKATSGAKNRLAPASPVEAWRPRNFVKRLWHDFAMSRLVDGESPYNPDNITDASRAWAKETARERWEQQAARNAL